MTKAEIIEQIADSTGFTGNDVRIIVEGFLQEVKNSLVEGKNLKIRKFETFKVKQHRAPRARNPKTGEEIQLPARRKAYFKAIQHRINGLQTVITLSRKDWRAC